jgi:hypothetical protein
VLGVVVGLAAGALVLSDVPLLAKLIAGIAVVIVGVAGPFGSVLLAGLLLGSRPLQLWRSARHLRTFCR